MSLLPVRQPATCRQRVSFSDCVLRRRLDVIGDATGGKKEQRNHGAALDFREMVAARSRRRPTGAAPSVGTGRNGALIQGNHHVQLAIGVEMVVPPIILLAVHIDSRDAELERFRARFVDLAAAVSPSVDLDIGGPTLLDPGLDKAGEGIRHSPFPPPEGVWPPVDPRPRRQCPDFGGPAYTLS